MRPKVRTVEGLLHLRYKSSQTIHTTAVYPRTSSNGSTAIVIGHECGLRVVWRGGRPFKGKLAGEPGDSQDDNTLDSDNTDNDQDSEEEDEAVDEDIRPDFEDEEEEFDLARPYKRIIQHKNVDIGTAVLHIAFPRIPQRNTQLAESLSPKLLEEKILVALACADSTIRLMTLPLTPPTDSSRSTYKLCKDDFDEYFGVRANWIDGMVAIPTTIGHTSLPRGVSIALARRPVTSIEDSDDDTMATGEPRSSEGYDALILSHSADRPGRMIIHRIPIAEDGLDIEEPPHDEMLWRAERLASPAASVQIHISPNAKEAESARVLVAEQSGAVRIYECGSEANPDQGYWGLTLHTGYSNHNGLPQERKILDAQWVLGGNSICVLLADGEWGLWDLSSSRIASTVTGSIFTKFSLSNWISTPFSKPSTSLAPITPNTRKIRQDALFAPPTSRSNAASDASSSATGAIVPQLTLQSENGFDDDESLLLWLSDRSIIIPSLRAHVRSKLKSEDPFSGGTGAQPRELAHVELPGERRVAAAVFPHTDDRATGGVTGLRARPRDLLVTGETGFVVVAPPLLEPEKKPVQQNQVEVEREDEVALLAQGDLGIDGLDRMLDDMAGGRVRKTVGFAAS